MLTLPTGFDLSGYHNVFLSRSCHTESSALKNPGNPCYLAAPTGVSAADNPASETRCDRAHEAWDTGDDVSVLQRFDALPRGPDAASPYDVRGDIMGGLGSYPFLGTPYYHDSGDLLEIVNHQLVTQVAKFNAAAIMLLAADPSPVKGLKVVKAGVDGVEVSRTNNLENGISYYIVSWGPEGKPPVGSRKVKEPRAVTRGLRTRAGEKWRTSI
jgi:hypothetical protein